MPVLKQVRNECPFRLLTIFNMPAGWTNSHDSWHRTKEGRSRTIEKKLADRAIQQAG